MKWCKSVGMSWENAHAGESHQVKKSDGLTDMGPTQRCAKAALHPSPPAVSTSKWLSTELSLPLLPPPPHAGTYNASKHQKAGAPRATVKMPAHELQPSPCLAMRACAALNLSAECPLGQTPHPTALKSSKLALKRHRSALLSLSKGCDRSSVLHCSVCAVAHSTCLPSYCWKVRDEHIWTVTETIRNTFIS